MPTAIDLFAGCGGLSKGLEDAGFNVVMANEIHEDASRTYEENLNRNKVNCTKMFNIDINRLTNEMVLDAVGDKFADQQPQGDRSIQVEPHRLDLDL